jgi:thiosulfate/3-mercaptopyruvate sulfurtransferase
MKKRIQQFGYIFLLLFSITVQAQVKQEPWTDSQLMPTQELADKINAGDKEKPLVLNIGPQAVIKGSVDVGPGKEKTNISKLDNTLSKVDKKREVVIYCGCCPFDKCPNIRPAFNELKELGFVNAKLLNIPKNIKVDWIDKGYPVNQ